MAAQGEFTLYLYEYALVTQKVRTDHVCHEHLHSTDLIYCWFAGSTCWLLNSCSCTDLHCTGTNPHRPKHFLETRNFRLEQELLLAGKENKFYYLPSPSPIFAKKEKRMSGRRQISKFI